MSRTFTIITWCTVLNGILVILIVFLLNSQYHHVTKCWAKHTCTYLRYVNRCVILALEHLSTGVTNVCLFWTTVFTCLLFTFQRILRCLTGESGCITIWFIHRHRLHVYATTSSLKQYSIIPICLNQTQSQLPTLYRLSSTVTIKPVMFKRLDIYI